MTPVKIIQISEWGNSLAGLGDDGNLYVWNPSLKRWDEA